MNCKYCDETIPDVTTTIPSGICFDCYNSLAVKLEVSHKEIRITKMNGGFSIYPFKHLEIFMSEKPFN